MSVPDLNTSADVAAYVRNRDGQWYAPEQQRPVSSDALLAHGLGHRVMDLEGDVRALQDECTKLRRERDEYRARLGISSAAVDRLTRELLIERGAIA